MMWYSQTGAESDVVLSTRIRLARNIREYPFPVRLDRETKKQICETVRDILDGEGVKLSYIPVSTLTAAQAVSLAERNLVSADFISKSDGALLLNGDESMSVMLCEEDHIRLQVIKPGLDLEGAYAEADETDNILEKHLNYAFDERLGYLTQCPTNLGTGMRASVMLHLPALAAAGNMTRLAATVAKLGITLRSANADGAGDIYQLSNQVTLGISETAATENLKSIVLQIASQERQARKSLVKDEKTIDRIYRSFGILKSAYLMTSAEYTKLYSAVRLGICEGLIDADINKLNELYMTTQPATVNAANGGELNAAQRDAVRAKTVRDALG
ncbi:MAG: protein arginine kinase [Clostridia bacterium]|nr:protein arginine kinase [Clostridia bacterium]